MKTRVDDLKENIYNIKTSDSGKKKYGLNEEVIREISKEKNEPDWVLDIRLKAYEQYKKLPMPTWGPDLSELDLDNIASYVSSDLDMVDDWEKVPEDIKGVFDKLGIPEAERNH